MTNLTVTVKTIKSVEDTTEKSPRNLWGDENFLQQQKKKSMNYIRKKINYLDL